MIFYSNNNLEKSKIDFTQTGSFRRIDLNGEVQEKSIFFESMNVEMKKEEIFRIFPPSFSEFVNVGTTTGESNINVGSTTENVNGVSNITTGGTNSNQQAENVSTTSLTQSSASIQESPETISDKMMTRDVIVNLRILRGEGTDSSQFSEQFPYERI